MLIKARDYQAYAANSVLDFFISGKPGVPLVLMPTGTGKSVVIGDFIEKLLLQWPRLRICVVTHVKELVDQNAKKLLDIWPNAPCGIYSSGLRKRQSNAQVLFAGIGSIVRRMDEIGTFDIIIVDEAHMISTNDVTQYQIFFKYQQERNPNVKVWGTTATGYRMGHGSLIEEGGLFTDIVCDMTTYEAFNWFLSQGYLLPPVPRPVQTILDVSGVHIRGGEFVAAELIEAVDKDYITEKALDEVMEFGYNRKHWLIFASGVKHAETIQSMLQMRGISCGIVTSKSGAKRDSEIAKFKAGHYRAMVNMGVLTTGFDFPAIDLIVMLRPTMSTVLWVQMLGRGTRPLYVPGFDLETVEGRWSAIMASDKHDCLVLDFANNTRRLGPINEPVLPRKKGKKGGTAPIKDCDVCGTPNHTRALWCVNCHAQFSFDIKIKQQSSTEELVKKLEEPIIDIFKVDHTTYLLHTKADSPPMMKVAYQCGAKSFFDYVCVEHEGWAGRKALSWWRKRTGDSSLPVDLTTGRPSTKEALRQFQRLATPTHLSVHVNKKYPEITDYCFDGTAFNRQADTGERPSVLNDIATPSSAPTQSNAMPSYEQFMASDDIPF